MPLTVRDLMTANPQTIHPTEVLSVAQDMMQQGRFRRLPVVDDAGNLLGIIADGDLREHVGYLPTTRVTAAMSEELKTITPETTIPAAAKLMVEHKIGALLVVDSGGRLVGIITETDLLRAFVESLSDS